MIQDLSLTKYLYCILFFILVSFTKDTSSFDLGIIVDKKLERTSLNYIKKGLMKYYNCKVHLLEDIDLPKAFRKDTINFPRLMDFLEKEIETGYDKNIYLTESGLTFKEGVKESIRGFTKTDGKYGIVSSLVVKNETSTKKEFKYQFLKVAIHEVGHLLGVGHCKNEKGKCVMISGQTYPKRFYNTDNEICNICLEGIDGNVIRKKR